MHFPDIPEHSSNFYLYLITTLLHNLITLELLFIPLNHSAECSRVFHSVTVEIARMNIA